ncbi:UNVERIFIED_CONTAM: movement protein [Sesamum latifolium]|uniref:Movement protein n=1 Tax=Sesamum latifolium TaxID=2727402 RepID=A0AAW2UW01_9LAMI
MDLQLSQNNYNEGDRLQTSESQSGFFFRMTVSNKTMERIMRQDFNLSPYDGFRIGGIGRVLNQIGLNQRRHHIIYKVSSGEFAIPMELPENVMKMQLIPKEEILEELSKLREEVAVTMKWIHIEAIEGKLMFDIHPRIAYNLADQDFNRVLILHQDFKRKDLMKEGNRPYSITYRIAYALSNTHHSDLFLRKEYIEIPRIFKEFAKQPVIGRYEDMLEITGHEILVAGVDSLLGNNFIQTFAKYVQDNNRNLLIFITNFGSEIQVLRKEKAFNRIMLINFHSKRGDFNAKLTHPKMQDKRKFGKALLSFRQQGLIDSDSFYEESEEEIKTLKEALQEIKSLDVSEESKLSLENVKRLIQRNFSENLLAWWIGIRSKQL